MKKNVLAISTLLTTGLLVVGCGNKPAHTHIPDEPTYSAFTADHKCTGTIVCKDCGQTVVTETVEGVYTPVKNPTCTEDGSANYVYTFTKEGLEKELYEPVVIPSTGHLDDDHDHFCDTCELLLLEHTHEEGTISDHKCDYCGAELTNLHVDSNADHLCDVCEVVMSECVDLDHNHICDYCNVEMSSLHIDEDFDHLCDICEKKLSECTDENSDHICDYCEKELTDLHTDSNEDHVCDVCDKELIDEHYDFDSDGFCDVCEVIMPTVKLVAPLTYMGRGETLHLSSIVDPRLGNPEDVKWEVTESSRFILTDNEDGTADIYCTSNTSITTYTTDVYVSLKSDETYFDTVKLSCSTYNSTKRTQISDFFGDWQYIPYLSSTTFTNPATSGDPLTASTTNNFEKTLGAFRNMNKFIESTRDGKNYFYGTCGYDAVEICVYYDNSLSKTLLTFTKLGTDYSTFPSEIVQKIMAGQTTLTIPGPTDGSYFYYLVDNQELVVCSDSLLDKFVMKLSNEGYSIIETKSNTICTSPDRSLVIKVANVYGETEVRYSVQEVCTDTDWSDNTKDLMNKTIGTVLPFAPVGYKTVSVDIFNTLTMLNGMSDAYLVMQTALDTDTEFEKETVDGGVFYRKPISDTQQLTVGIATNGILSAYFENRAYTTWQSDLVANTLGNKTTTMLPTAEGTSFTYELGNESIKVDVMGDMENYKTKLVNASFKTVKSEAYSSTYLSNDGTLTVVVQYYTAGEFIISANAHYKEGVSDSFPLTAVKNIIGKQDANDVIPANGDMFTLVKNEDYDVSVTVEGGDKVEFMHSLLTYGFTSTVAREFTKNNMKILVSEGSDTFTIRYVLIEKPQGPVWPSEKLVEYYPTDGSTFPEPENYTLVSVNCDDSTKKITMNMTGITATQFKQLLSGEGYDSYNGYAYSPNYEMYIEWSTSNDVLTVSIEPSGW